MTRYTPARNAKISAAMKRHGMTGTPTYKSWESMKRRCTRTGHKSYKDYGGRGITVCERWMEFENFLADLGPRPPGTTIDRIDNDIGYSKENCRWATRDEQRLNQSNCRFVVLNGERMPIRHAADRMGLDERTVHSRIRRGWEITAALTTPAKYRKLTGKEG